MYEQEHNEEQQWKYTVKFEHFYFSCKYEWGFISDSVTVDLYKPALAGTTSI